MKKIKFVDVFDFKTRKVTAIPAPELTPGMVMVNVMGVGKVWVDSAQIKFQNKFRHETLSPELMEDIGRIKDAMAEVHPRSMKQWVDGFRCDATPETEVKAWLRIVKTYQVCIVDKELTPEQRKEYFNVILIGSHMS